MLPVAAGSVGWMYPAKLSAALPKYRELLRTAHNSRSVESSAEESSSLFLQAKERVLQRLRERRGAPARVDPRRAFSRLQQRWTSVRLSLRELKTEQKERLWQYVSAAVSGKTASIVEARSSSSASDPVASELAGAAAADCAVQRQLDAAAAQAAMGTDGPLRHLVLASVGGACRLFLAAGTHTSVLGREHMAAALARAPGRGLITVSNHVGSIDDPLITSALVPASSLLHPSSVRWTLCATDRCFKSATLARFFRAGKVLPVERGAGLSQFGMQLAQSRLREGEWVHIFPEGTRSRDGRMLPVRKGVGWLVATAAAAGGEPPLVLPFVHGGMERILPKGSSLPKLGQELRVLVGEPVEVSDLLGTAAQEGWAQERLQAAIADRVGQTLYRLKAELEGLPLEAVAPQPTATATSISEDTLLPLIEDEMDSLAHRWQDRWQRLSLPSLTQRMRSEAAERRAALRAGGVFGAAASFEEIAAATEEASGLVSSWEHAGAAPLPWAAALPAAEAGGASAHGWSDWHAGELPAVGDGAAAESTPLALLQKLRLLRGGVQAAAANAALMLESASSSSSGDSALDFLAASPLDAVAASLAPVGVAGTQLHSLLAAAADYSAARVQHMRELLLPGAACSPSAHATA